MTDIIAAGFIVQDKGGNAILSVGATEAEARAEAMDFAGPWEDRDGNTVSPDHPEFGFDAKLTILPATASLIAQVKAWGGAIAWDVVTGIACTCDEASLTAVEA